jgi:septal ring factor EnvC (AmiA/AmiB activator)
MMVGTMTFLRHQVSELSKIIAKLEKIIAKNEDKQNAKKKETEREWRAELDERCRRQGDSSSLRL